MTTRTLGDTSNIMKNLNISSPLKRNKDRKKDRDRDRNRGKEREIDRENTNKDRKKMNYEDLDFPKINSFNNNNNQNSHYDEDPTENIVERNLETNSPKYSKGLGWPYHSNKGVNDYEPDKTEPKYYLGKHLGMYFRCLMKKGSMFLSFSGTLISGTHCSRIFSDCDKKACRLQSPNYPGIYPRNLTCYYAIRQV